MNRILKTLVTSAVIGATMIASVGTASADGWRRHHHHGGGGDAVAAGVAGLAVGALIGSALSAPRSTRTYIDEAPVYDDPYYDPAPTYVQRRVYVEEPTYVQRRVYVERAGLQPWSQSWMRYCMQRYRTFDPRTGTFVGNDGREHFCRG